MGVGGEWGAGGGGDIYKLALKKLKGNMGV